MDMRGFMVKMKKAVGIFVLFLVVINLSGCFSLHKRVKRGPQVNTMGSAVPLPVYLGPKAYIAVADFDIKTAKANNEMGSGLREMLISALSGNSRFSLVERQETKNMLTGSVVPETQQTVNTTENNKEPADLIITVAVTEFEPQASGGSDGLGGGGGVGNGNFGGLLGGSLNKAKIALDVRIVDAATSEVISSTLIQGRAADSAAGIGAELEKLNLGASLSAYTDTSMEKAIRVCILETARYLSQSISAKYYKYKVNNISS